MSIEDCLRDEPVQLNISLRFIRLWRQLQQQYVPVDGVELHLGGSVLGLHHTFHQRW